MRTVKKKETKEINWAIPEQTVSHDDFITAIKKAEAGPFYSFDEAQERLKLWKKERSMEIL
jgi:hypothetical protein